MGSACGEFAWRTDRSSWFGHQSWFVRGRAVVGVGEGICGFSLSLSLTLPVDRLSWGRLSDTSNFFLSVTKPPLRTALPEPRGARRPGKLAPPEAASPR